MIRPKTYNLRDHRERGIINLMAVPSCIIGFNLIQTPNTRKYWSSARNDDLPESGKTLMYKKWADAVVIGLFSGGITNQNRTDEVLAFRNYDTIMNAFVANLRQVDALNTTFLIFINRWRPALRKWQIERQPKASYRCQRRRMNEPLGLGFTLLVSGILDHAPLEQTG